MESQFQLSVATLEEALDALLDRVDTTLAETGTRFPLVADPDTGKWETTTDGNWCGGHWIGLLWLAAAHRDDTTFERAAREHTHVLRESMPRATMFFGMNAHYAGFRGYDYTHDRSLFGLGLEGADAMVSLFDQSARQVPSGTLDIEGGDSFVGSDDPDTRFTTTAVDNVYTALPVLWRAYDETGDRTFLATAVSHADRHLDWFIDDDGRTCHHARFDGETGELTDQWNDLAYSDETCWARGQGWNLAGLARAFDETGAGRYLDGLERTLDYYLARVPDDLVPYWDFEAPEVPNAPRDTSAAALAAYGLSRIERDGRRAADLRETGERILASLLDDYVVTDPDDDRRGAVCHGCYDKPGEYATDNELIWTDYYVAFAVDALLDRRTTR